MQRMIKDTHERWLDQEEEYEQEREAFYKASAHMNLLHYRSYNMLYLMYVVSLYVI